MRTYLVNALRLLGLMVASGAVGGAVFTTIDVPQATDAALYCVNAAAELCGSWIEASGVTHGLVIPSSGQTQSFDFPEAGTVATYVIGLNSQGDAVGMYTTKTDHAWMQLHGQGAARIDPPGSTSAIARGINDSGSVAGGYIDAAGQSHGFILAGGSYKSINYPQAIATDAWDVDGGGDVVGQYTASDQSTHGFLLKGGAFSAIDFPGAQFTIADRITGDGRILGFYALADGKSHGFLLANGVYTAVDVPGAVQTRTRGLNAMGEVVGAYIDASGHNHGFTTNLAPSASSPGPFPMTVAGTIGAGASANVEAQVEAPPQLVGTTASIYVFAHVRQSLLVAKRASVGAAPSVIEDTPGADPCVLAQLNANGQLVAASASSLHPYVTGVLGTQSQSVTILNNVASPNVAGASFFVGYGATSIAMFASGMYEGAVTVPGPASCSAALLAGAAPNAPGALSGLWWNASESGWGVNITQRRNVVFAAWFTYDSSGNAKWYVASACVMPSGAGTSGTCNGALYEVSGPPFFGAAFDASTVHATNVGTLQVDFQDADNASMSYTVNGQARTVSITRQSFATGTLPPAVDYTDLWWNASESGWGIAVTQQYGTMFLAWYVYDAGGRPVWYVASSCTVVGSGCSGPLYRTTGPPFGPAFDPAAVHVTAVGTVSAIFTDANDAQLDYTVNGVAGTKTITRQLF